MKDYPWGKGTPVWVRDATANDSDKSFTVPAGKVWAIKYIYAFLTTSADAGNRLPSVQTTDGTDQMFIISSTAQAATTGAEYWFAPNMPGFSADKRNVTRPDAFYPLPDLVLPAGYVIRVYDSAAIAAAADDLIVVLHYVEYDA